MNNINFNNDKQQKIKAANKYYNNLIIKENDNFTNTINKKKIEAYNNIRKLYYPQNNEDLSIFSGQRRLNQLPEIRVETIESIMKINNTDFLNLEKEKDNKIQKSKEDLEIAFDGATIKLFRKLQSHMIEENVNLKI
jgi:hypothetical protein